MRTVVTALLVVGVVLLSACGPEDASAGPDDPPDAALAALAEQTSAELVDAMRAAVEDAPRHRVDFVGPEKAFTHPEVTVLTEGDVAEVRYEGPPGGHDARIISADETVCFNEIGSVGISQHVVMSYGSVVTEKAWTCAPWSFRPTALLLGTNERAAQIDAVLDGLAAVPGDAVMGVSRVDGEDLLELMVSGPAGVRVRVWLDAQARPRRIVDRPQTWEISYPEEPFGLAVPENAGAFGFAPGPGQGVAKACHQSGHQLEQCRDGETALQWSDGRQ